LSLGLFLCGLFPPRLGMLFAGRLLIRLMWWPRSLGMCGSLRLGLFRFCLGRGWLWFVVGLGVGWLVTILGPCRLRGGLGLGG
jgi:hypothetical protein